MQNAYVQGAISKENTLNFSSLKPYSYAIHNKRLTPSPLASIAVMIPVQPKASSSATKHPSKIPISKPPANIMTLNPRAQYIELQPTD